MAGPTKFSIRREQFADRAQNVQEQQRATLARRLNQCPLLPGRMISVTFSGAAQLTVTHGLGVPARFVQASGEYTAATFLQVRELTSQTGIDTNNQTIVVSNGAGTCDLWFYPRSSGVIPTGASQSP